MRYTLLIRAILNTKLKEDAEANLDRRFPGIAVEIEGRYWKDPSLWEASSRQECNYPDDFAALWHTLRLASNAASNWLIVSGPNDGTCSELISAVYNNPEGNGLAWCSIELLRVGESKSPGSAIDV